MEPSRFPQLPATLRPNRPVMSMGTLQVGATTTPTIIRTLFTHYLQKHGRKKKVKKTGVEDPSLDLVYDEGIKVLRAFLEFAAKQTLEETQTFTALYVPCPHYVRKEVVHIPQEGCIDRAEELLEKQLDSYGPESIKRVGGRRWWKIRGKELEGEWIEMKRDYIKRTKWAGSASTADRERYERVLLYVHGGAYFFSSLDTHRYQIQRHARKLGGRAFAPAYRLAPQYPFPCGILDSLAAYLYLINPPPGAAHEPIPPSSIILSGDSAGAGIVLALLVTIRDQGLPMPAGANLLSPWVDLCHSFPSVVQNRDTDYIPGNGFHFRSSLAWPPVEEEPFLVETDKPGEEGIKIYEQIQMYTTNALLTHPLVSPVNHGSLGGLCPLLVHSGGGELLRDEQIYIAHKAANPTKYPASETVLQDYPNQADLVDKYKPTKVQLQVFDGCAHVIPTLSVTTPAKYMYRSAANFNIWALMAAKKKVQQKASRGASSSNKTSTPSSSILVTREDETSTLGSAMHTTEPKYMMASPISDMGMDERFHLAVNASMVHEDDLQSELSDTSFDSEFDDEVDDRKENKENGEPHRHRRKPTGVLSDRIIVSGSLPTFGPGHIIRQRASCHGRLRQMEPEVEIKALNLSPGQVGRVHIDGPVSYWLETREKFHSKYSTDLEHFRRIKSEDYVKAKEHGFLTRDMHGEDPPQCALASWYDLSLAREVGRSVDEVAGKSSKAVSLYMKISQKADREQVGDVQDTGDEDTVERVKSQHEHASPLEKVSSRLYNTRLSEEPSRQSFSLH